MNTRNYEDYNRCCKMLGLKQKNYDENWEKHFESMYKKYSSKIVYTAACLQDLENALNYYENKSSIENYMLIKRRFCELKETLKIRR